MRTPQFSLGDVGEGAAGVSTNSKSPSEVSEADLTIIITAEDILGISVACSSVLPMNFVEKAWHCGLHHAGSVEMDTPEPLLFLIVVALTIFMSDHVRCYSSRSSMSPSLGLYIYIFDGYLATDPRRDFAPLNPPSSLLHRS